MHYNFNNSSDTLFYTKIDSLFNQNDSFEDLVDEYTYFIYGYSVI